MGHRDGPSSSWSFDRFIGRSSAVRALEETVRRIAATDLTVLIEGETGTGKTFLARILHHSGHRSKRHFVTVFCPSLEKGVVENELFGHRKGAFTGSGADRIGKVQEAEGGTLFMDEVGELPADIQPKLLRLLQEKTFERMGDPKERTADVRVVAATNRDLAMEVAAGRFRRDLYERLRFAMVTIPPVRDRREDIPLLLRHALDTHEPERRIEISDDVIRFLVESDHPWLGNVREIERLAAQIAMENPREPVSRLDIERLLGGSEGAVLPEGPVDSSEALRDTGLADRVRSAEKAALEAALRENPHLTRAGLASKLGISERSLYDKQRRFGLRDSRDAVAKGRASAAVEPGGRGSANAPPPSSEVTVSGKVDWTGWRRERIAEWSRPRYRLDKEFVALTLLVDQGEEAAGGRWSARPERYRDLGELFAAVDDAALVLLGSPGSGKSTLLRRFEMDVAEAAVAGRHTPDTITFFIQLNHYRPQSPGGPLPEPGAWLAERWCARFPTLPPLSALLAEERVVLLLDALNEVPAENAAGLREAVLQWKEFLDRLATERPGNRVVFSCRTLDYSAPLSTSRLRVPQVVIEPMTDDQVEQFLIKHSPEKGETLWSQLKGTPQLEMMRLPYFLMLLVEQVDAAGGIPEGRSGLFTGFVRHALKREVERNNPMFAPGALLAERDIRKIAQWRWRNPWELPERGALIPKLADLAFWMQVSREDGGASQVRVGFDEALDRLGHDQGEDIVRAGVALSVLDEDAAHDELLFYHQLVQEYFAGRRMAAAPDPSRVGTAWRAGEISPPLAEVLRSLPPSETLPALPTTGWEETALLAGEMTRDPDDFVRGLMTADLPLAGRTAAQPDVRGRLSQGLLKDLRRALSRRSRDASADLRARIAAGLALGPLGDPRFERRRGPHGDYLFPPLVVIPAGRYPVGEDEPFEVLGDTWTDHMPRHDVGITAFRIGRVPVTNAEWALFMESGGYEDEKWWDTETALQWQRGEGTAAGIQANARYWLGRFRENPSEVEKRWAAGNWSEAIYDRWKKRLAMSEAELEAHLRELYPGGTLREPAFWRDATWNNPSQPVVGVCWFEARAYCNWLSAQADELFRLPTEAEWEAAARGREGRRHGYGNEFDPLKGNTAETRIRRTTPVGAFVEGDTPEGVSDMTGNVEEWTASLFGTGGTNEPPTFGYPYRPDDGREDPSARADVRRVLRGGAWFSVRVYARAAHRDGYLPSFRNFDYGLRLAAAAVSRDSAGHRCHHPDWRS